MKPTALLVAAVASLATLACGQADEPGRKRIAHSIPAEVVLCVRLDLKAARGVEQAAGILGAATQQFRTQIDAIGQISSMALGDVDGVWFGTVKDNEALVVLEGEFNTDAILNSSLVTGSRRLVRPGTITAVEMYDEKKDELSQAVVIDEHIVAFGLPRLVDRFVDHYVGGKSAWDKSGQAVMEGIASSGAMLQLAFTRLPEKEIRQKPFLATVVTARLEADVREKVTATATVTLQDEAKATALRDLVSGFLGLGLAGEIKTGYPDLQKALLGGLKLGTEGRTVTLSSTMEIEPLRQMLRAKGLQLN